MYRLDQKLFLEKKREKHLAVVLIHQIIEEMRSKEKDPYSWKTA